MSMSFGKMNTFIDLVKKEVSVDAEGFKSEKGRGMYLEVMAKVVKPGG